MRDVRTEVEVGERANHRSLAAEQEPWRTEAGRHEVPFIEDDLEALELLEYKHHFFICPAVLSAVICPMSQAVSYAYIIYPSLHENVVNVNASQRTSSCASVQSTTRMVRDNCIFVRVR